MPKKSFKVTIYAGKEWKIIDKLYFVARLKYYFEICILEYYWN